MQYVEELWITAVVTVIKYSILTLLALYGEPSTNTGIVVKYAALALMDILVDALKKISFARPSVHAAVATEDADTPAAVVVAAPAGGAAADTTTARVAAANCAIARPPATYDDTETNFAAGN
ncbi:hypothetical protein AAVH_41946 [Aphelenchoides avenae]|nr:hypothetical protein AAVH_41946 [Aphelenchus avenae]